MTGKWTRLLLVGIAIVSLTLSACGGGGGGGGGVEGVDGSPGLPPINSDPIANAGPDQNVTTGSKVTLDGSGSYDPDGDLLTFLWIFSSKPDGSTATLSEPTAVNPIFFTDYDGEYVLHLTVDDGAMSVISDPVTITASAAAPAANAGPDQKVATSSTVTLDGGGSFYADGDFPTFNWVLTTRPDGSSASLIGETTIFPRFTTDVDGTYIVRLTINDGTANSTTDTVTINSTSDYSSLFVKTPSVGGVTIMYTWYAGSSFSLNIKNSSNIPFSVYRAELRNGEMIIGSTENLTILGGGTIQPKGELKTTVTLQFNVVDYGFVYRYYLRRIDTGEEFIVSHEFIY